MNPASETYRLDSHKNFASVKCYSPVEAQNCWLGSVFAASNESYFCEENHIPGATRSGLRCR